MTAPRALGCATRPLPLPLPLPLLLAVVVALVAQHCGVARAGLFDGPTVDGDTYKYDGKGKVFDPADAFSADDAFNHITLSNWDMARVANLSIPRTVQTLILFKCNLSTVPNEIDTLEHLQTLSMVSNALTAVEADFASATKLSALDLSKNALASVPAAVFSSKQLNALFVDGNKFQIESVSVDEFDFYAGLSDFKADFVQVAACANGSELVNLKGARVCRVNERLPTLVPPVTTAPSTTPAIIPVPAPMPVTTTAPSPTNATVIVTVAPAAVTDTTGKSNRTTYIASGMVFVLLAIGMIGGLYMFIVRRQTERFRGVLHEETPLFFDSEKRTTYHQELAAGDKLFPSNDPVLVTWRLDYDAIKLVRRIAKGAYGEVWIGRYRGNRVAVKKLLEEHISFEGSEDFIREIKLMAWLKHPKVVEFVGVAWTRLVDMMAVTEFMDSGDLRSYLDANRDIKWSTHKLQYAIDIIDAIVYLHSLSPVIIHRDLKSRNILVDAKKGAKLGDFGISAAKRDRDMTVGVGTTRWLAPELARGEAQYSEAVDIYSFGVILSELDTHDLPYQDERTPSGEKLSDFAILQGVASGDLQLRYSPSCPPKLYLLAERCTSNDPSDRPTAAECAYLMRQRGFLQGGSLGGSSGGSSGGFV